MKIHWLLLPVLPVLAIPAHADWAGLGSAGFAVSSGNARSESANAKLDIANEIGLWKHSLLLDGLYSSSNAIAAADRWEIKWQSDHKLGGARYAFGALRHEDDRFGPFSHQESATAGLGYRLLDTKITKLSVQASAGVKQDQEQTLVRDGTGKVVSRIDGQDTLLGVFTLGLSYEHTLTATTRVQDKLLVETTSQNTFVQNDLGLNVAISDKLALGIAYGLRENTSPPPGARRTDALTTINLVYTIK